MEVFGLAGNSNYDKIWNCALYNFEPVPDRIIPRLFIFALFLIIGCAGTCQNMLSCMFSGQKVDWDANDACPGMVNSCCTAWTPRKKYFRNRIKSGRSLGLFSPQVQVNFAISRK